MKRMHYSLHFRRSGRSSFLIGAVFVVQAVAQAATPPSLEVYSAPFRCSPEAYVELEKGIQRELSPVEDLRVMRRQSEIFVRCVQDALAQRSAEWRLAHPYALLADLYQMAIPYMDTSAEAIAGLRRSEIERVLSQMDARMTQFLRRAPEQMVPVPGDVPMRDLRSVVRGLQREASEQASSGVGALASTASEVKFIFALKEAWGRKFRDVRRKLCAFKAAADHELVSQAKEASQLGIPQLPPQVIYCAP